MSYKTELQSNNTDLQSILDMILALGLVDAPKLITFTIAGTEYQAEEGMTWAEWCESEYNSITAVAYDTIISTPSGSIQYNGSNVGGADVIILNGVYTLYVASGGGQ